MVLFEGDLGLNQTTQDGQLLVQVLDLDLLFETFPCLEEQFVLSTLLETE